MELHSPNFFLIIQILRSNYNKFNTPCVVVSSINLCFVLCIKWCSWYFSFKFCIVLFFLWLTFKLDISLGLILSQDYSRYPILVNMIAIFSKLQDIICSLRANHHRFPNENESIIMLHDQENKLLRELLVTTKWNHFFVRQQEFWRLSTNQVLFFSSVVKRCFRQSNYQKTSLRILNCGIFGNQTNSLEKKILFHLRYIFLFSSTSLKVLVLGKRKTLFLVFIQAIVQFLYN